MCALLVIIIYKQNRSWRMYMEVQDIKCYIYYQDCIVGLFFAIGLHSDWEKCIVIPHMIMHISAIHNLTTL